MRARGLGVDQGLGRGCVRVPDGRQATCAFAHSTELIGGTAIISHLPRIVIQVVVRSTLTSLDLPRVRKLAVVESEVTTAVAMHLAVLVPTSFKLIAVLTLGDIQQGIAYVLLDRACLSHVEVGR